MKTILFERNSESDTLYQSGGIGFDCLHGSKTIGRFCVYKNKSLAKVQEVYIEVYEDFQGKGYGKDIYANFIKKARKLGFKNPEFYAVVYTSNKASLKLCEKMGFDQIDYWHKKAKAFKFRVA